MNSPIYNRLVVSSRENFVIAIGYDVLTGSIRKIHWILGDTTKHWYGFPSLQKSALTTAPERLPPIRQHSHAIDSGGNLLLLDDGFGGEFQYPAGITRGYSVVNSDGIDSVTRSATAVSSYDPRPNFYGYICRSAYDAGGGGHLIDFATAPGDSPADIRGLGPSNSVVFDLKLPQISACGVGWNALTLPSTPIIYQ